MKWIDRHVIPAGVAVAWLLSGALAHAAGGPPHYDVDGHCKRIASIGGSYSAGIDRTCFSEEQAAYDRLKAHWSGYAGRARDHCDHIARVGGGGSYGILETCLKEEAKDAAANAGRAFKY